MLGQLAELFGDSDSESASDRDDRDDGPPEAAIDATQLASVFEGIADELAGFDLDASDAADLEELLDDLEQSIPRTQHDPPEARHSEGDPWSQQVARVREFATRLRTGDLHDQSQALKIQSGIADIDHLIDSMDCETDDEYAFIEQEVNQFKGRDVISRGVPYDALDDEEGEEDTDEETSEEAVSEESDSDQPTIAGCDPGVSDVFDERPTVDIDESLPDASGEASEEGKEWADDDVETYAGPRARSMINASSENPSQPLWIGQGGRNGRDAGIEKEYLFRHQGIFGITGYGKSTLLKNQFRQLIDAGYGGCFIDPKGDDSEELMEIIPDHRADDVIWIEPGSSREYISGFNFLEVSLDPDNPMYDTAVENLVDDLVSMLGAGDYWGPRMDRVAQSLIRAMNRSKHDFNILDMYYILADQESRQQFAELVKEEGIDFVDVYIQEIAELDDDDLEPLLGRFQSWVENPIARRLIAFRDSEIDIPEAVEDNKIIIVRMGSESKELKGMIGMAVIRRIWATIRSRAEMAQRDRDPFYLYVDEFDNVAREDGTVETMLSEARSYRLSLTFCTQYPSQLPEGVQRGMFVNADSLVSFNPGHIDEAQVIAANLDIDAQSLQNTPNYKVWMQVTLSDQEKSPAFKVYTFPPYPPVRTRDEAMTLVEESLRRYGRPQKTNAEVKDELMFQFGTGVLERQGIAGDSTTTGTAIPDTDGASSDQRSTLLESAYAAQIKQDAKGEFVPATAVEVEWERRAGDLGYQSQSANVIEQVPEELLERERHSDGLQLRVTPDGLEEAGLTQNTGSGASGGGNDHRWVLTKAYEAFTKFGMHCALPTQEGEEQPDGLADLPPALDPNPREGDTYQDQRKRERRLREDEPHLWQFTQGQHISVEAETTTIDKPKQTLHNLRKAVEVGKLCVFALKEPNRDKSRVPDDAAFTYWAERGEQIIYDEAPDGTLDYDRLTFVSSVDDRGNRTFFNNATYLTVDGETALRPKTDPEQDGRTRAATWSEHNGRVVLEDHEGDVQAELPKVEAVEDPAREDVAAYYEENDGEYVVRAGSEKYTYGSRDELTAEWAFIYRPFIPEVEFDRLPQLDDFEFVIFPNDDTDEYDEPMVYEQGDLRPLFPDDLDADVLDAGDATWGTPEGDSEPTGEADEQDHVEEADSGDHDSPAVECCGNPALASQHDEDTAIQTGWVCSSCFTEFTLDGTQINRDEPEGSSVDASESEGTPVDSNESEKADDDVEEILSQWK